uniref:Uncharacterized protein n=1 Tax=Romanomermis culicivorax TaxID=13658 RepID=A0A915IMH6_ROMCU
MPYIRWQTANTHLFSRQILPSGHKSTKKCKLVSLDLFIREKGHQASKHTHGTYSVGPPLATGAVNTFASAIDTISIAHLESENTVIFVSGKLQ